MNQVIVNDGHIHISDGFADQAVSYVDAAGGNRFNVLSLTQILDDPLNNLTCLLAKALHPGRTFAFCSLTHPHPGEPAPDYAAQLALWMEAGFDGLKLIETKPNCCKETGVRLDDARFEPLFSRLEREAVPIIWHVGDPATFWDPALVPSWAAENGWAYLDGSFPTLEELYRQTENVFARHPLLKATLAHFYFTSDAPKHAAHMFESYPNLRFDLTPGTEMYDGFTRHADFFRPFFLKYADRLILGTDTDVDAVWDESRTNPQTRNILRYLSTDDSFLFGDAVVKGFQLPDEVVGRIAGKNHEAFVTDTPRTLDRDAVMRACAWVRALTERRGDAWLLAKTDETIEKLQGLSTLI